MGQEDEDSVGVMLKLVSFEVFRSNSGDIGFLKRNGNI